VPNVQAFLFLVHSPAYLVVGCLVTCKSENKKMRLHMEPPIN
jgi:hypothetical protein